MTTRKELVEIIFSRKDDAVEKMFDLLLTSQNITLENFSEECALKLKEELTKFQYNVKSKLKICGSSKSYFYKKFKDWINAEYILNEDFKTAIKRRLVFSDEKNTPGRPEGSSTKGFSDLGRQQKWRKTRVLTDTYSTDALLAATTRKIKPQSTDLYHILKLTPSKWKQLTEAQKSKHPIPLTTEDSLAFLVHNNFSKAQYKSIRMTSLNHNCNIYSSYEKVREAKNECFPMNITINEYKAEVPLQNLLDHTITRLIKCQEEVIHQQFSSNDEIVHVKGTLICKWGFDGSTGQSIYKQKFSTNTSNPISEGSVLFTSLVPLDLSIDDILIWRNPTPSSTRYCRPISMEYIKETAEVSLQLKNDIDNQIKNLNNTFIKIPIVNECGIIVQEINVEIEHVLQMTAVDGKVINAAVSNTAQGNCFLCGAKPSEMNIINNFSKKVIDKTPLNYGLSTLHARIRCFECILHIGYRLDIKKWQIREADKNKCFKRKKQIIEDFRQKMSLIVDVPKPGGSGNSNDGNTARRAFMNVKLFSEITGVDVNLIQRISTILGAITCGFAIDTLKFASYCKQTLELYVKLYPWFYMPVTLHKILVHGPVIVKRMILPIGLYSEEAQESRNKDIKNARLYHSRKDTREHTITDQFRYLLVTSDPLISSKKNLSHKKRQPLTKDIISLLELEKKYTPQLDSDDEEEDHDEQYSSSNLIDSEDISVSDIVLPDDFYDDTHIDIPSNIFYKK